MVLLLQNAPIPINDPIALPKRPQYGKAPDPQEGRISPAWVDYFTVGFGQVTLGPTRLNSTQQSGLAGSLPPTDLSGGVLGAGLYRLTYYAAITQAAGVSSSLTVTLAWTDRGIAKAVSGAAITGNTTNTTQSNMQLLRIDAATPVSISTTYASVGAPVMEYGIDAVLEAVHT
jgi:hypothetical protein